jgi:hypothetical protein
MSAMSDPVSPGFYPAPEGPSRERWWNGQGWSDAYRDGNNGVPTTVAPVSPQDPVPVELSGALLTGGSRARWRPKTMKQALLIPLTFTAICLAIIIFVIREPLLALVAVALGVVEVFVLIRQVKNQNAKPEAISFQESLSMAQGVMPQTAAAAPPHPAIAPSPAAMNRTGKGIRNAAITFFASVGIALLGVAAVFLASALGGHAEPDGSTSLTGAPAFIAFFGFLLAASGFLLPIPAAIAAFLVTVKR